MAGIPRTRSWLGRDPWSKRARISRRSETLDFDEDEVESDVRKTLGKDIFASSMSDVLGTIFNDIDQNKTKPVEWEDAIDIMVRAGGKAVALGATLVVSHGILLGVKSAYQKLMVFKW